MDSSHILQAQTLPRSDVACRIRRGSKEPGQERLDRPGNWRVPHARVPQQPLMLSDHAPASDGIDSTILKTRLMFCMMLLQALAPLSIGRDRLAACGLGSLWGFGHSTGQLILGLVFVLLKV
eukprot:365377-Chlamydomonas_euryale.AAC.13